MVLCEQLCHQQTPFKMNINFVENNVSYSIQAAKLGYPGSAEIYIKGPAVHLKPLNTKGT